MVNLFKISGKRPKIYRSINVFKEIETKTTIDYNQRILPNGRLPTRRRREDIRRGCDITKSEKISEVPKQNDEIDLCLVK
jgi:hypothetical protein